MLGIYIVNRAEMARADTQVSCYLRAAWKMGFALIVCAAKVVNSAC